MVGKGKTVTHPVTKNRFLRVGTMLSKLFFWVWFIDMNFICYCRWTDVHQSHQWSQNLKKKKPLPTWILNGWRPLTFPSLLWRNSEWPEELREAVFKQRVRVCQAALISVPLPDRHACLSGQKTKEWNTVQPGYGVHFTPPSLWKPNISWACGVTMSPILEERVRFAPGQRSRQTKETFPFCHG